jgi:Heterokaryon incompatibility protein (HET)
MYRFKPLYIYRPLNTGSKSIRLLDVSKRYGFVRGSQFTTCMMREFSIDSCPNYSALSYVWGRSEGSIPFLVDGFKVAITPNLFAALHEIHQKRMANWLWVDALCINQSDNEEKSKAVQQMRFVYQRAESVIARLEIDESPKSNVLEYVRLISEAVMVKMPFKTSHLTESLDSTGASSRTTCHQSDLDINLDQLMESLSSNSDLVESIVSTIFQFQYRDSIKAFLEQNIWRRIWILQEFASAESLFLLHRQNTLPLKYFFIIWAVLYYYAQGPRQEFTLAESLDNVKAMAPLLLHSTVWQKGRQRRSLLELLRATGRFQATDPRDKVFALLGIAKDTEELDLYPDYSKSYKSKCMDVAYKLIGQHGLSILSFAARPGSHELPSWAPEWNLNMVHTLGKNDRYFAGMDVCAGKLDNVRNATNRVSKIDTRLDVPCFHVGTIKAIGGDMSSFHGDLKMRAEMMFT